MLETCWFCAAIALALSCDPEDRTTSAAQGANQSSRPTPGTPIAGNELLGVLPEMQGWVREEPSIHVSAGGKVTTVRAKYREKPKAPATAAETKTTASDTTRDTKPTTTAATDRADSNLRPKSAATASDVTPESDDGVVPAVTVEVVDSNYVSSAFSRMAILAHANPQQDFHTLEVEIDGHGGIQQFDPEKKTSLLVFIVGQRFMVTLETERVPPGSGERWARAVDTKRLAAWAKQRPPDSGAR